MDLFGNIYGKILFLVLLLKKGLMIFVIAPELGSASPDTAHVLESAACCEYAYLELCVALLRDRSSGDTSDDVSGFVLPASSLDSECLSFPLFLWHVS